MQEVGKRNASAKNWTKDLLSMVLTTRARPTFIHSQSLPSINLHKPPILNYQMADVMTTTLITEN